MRSFDRDIQQLQVSLLQLQRSALIDTQAIMQILLDSGICTVDDIVNVRAKIEDSSPEVQRIDTQILTLGGDIIKTPDTEVQKNKKEQLGVLKELLQQLTEEGGLE